MLTLIINLGFFIFQHKLVTFNKLWYHVRLRNINNSETQLKIHGNNVDIDLAIEK